jgi:RNA polymerase sigma-70 factor (ECF subfamily)
VASSGGGGKAGRVRRGGEGKQKADAEHVTAIVVLKLFQKIKGAPYDPAKGRRRAWLKTVAHDAGADYVKDRQRAGIGSGNADRLESIEARDNLVHEIDEECERRLLHEAMDRVQLRVEPDTWQMFWLLPFGKESGNKVAQEFGRKLLAVYQAKRRVQELIKEELARLEGPPSAGPEKNS